jgi:hypothetical protein
MRTLTGRRWTAMCGALATLLLIAAGIAASAAVPEITWTVGSAGQGVPEVTAAGYTTFTLDNDGDEHPNLALYRLQEGTTLESLQAALARVDETMREGGPEAADAMNEALAAVDIIGEISADPGTRRTMGAVLAAGAYAIEYSTMGPQGPARTLRALQVDGDAAAGASPPEPDATVQFVDFAFALPSSIAPGEQTWLVVNRGVQLHHMVVFSLAEGMTPDDLLASMEEEPAEGAPPLAPVAHVGIISSGMESYHLIDLPAGRYAAYCFIPDHLGEATGQPHFMLGMMQEFSVGP